MRREPGGRRGAVPHQGPGSWLVALPAWGDRCARVCSEIVLPGLAAALGALGKPTRVLLYADDPGLVERATGLLPAEVLVRPVPGPDRAFMSMSACHQDALDRAARGERVLLLTADMLVSREVLATCEAWCAAGTQAVACVAMRALEDQQPPVGATGRELLAWAWENRHSMTRECTWPEGRSYDLWRMYFARDGEVSARVFLPHPLVVVPAGNAAIHFSPTIDVNLLGCFSQAVTRMITQPEEGAVVELSPADKNFLRTTSMRSRMDMGGPSCPPLVPATHRRHRMFFGKRAVIVGSGGDCGDSEVVERVLG